MGIYPISFPNLNLSFLINPVAFSFCGLKVHWYGIIIVTAIFIGIMLAKKDDGLYKIKYDDILDYAIIALFVGIICARLYYVVFNMEYYINNPSEIFKIWYRRTCNLWWNNWWSYSCIFLL